METAASFEARFAPWSYPASRDGRHSSFSPCRNNCLMGSIADGFRCSGLDERGNGVPSLLSVFSSSPCARDHPMGSIGDGFRCSGPDESGNGALTAISLLFFPLRKGSPNGLNRGQLRLFRPGRKRE
jgi:hypothetical protein